MGQAVRFSGSGQHYSRTALGLGATFTWCCWMKIVVDTNTYAQAMAQDNGGANYYQFGTINDGTTFGRDATSGTAANTAYDMGVGNWVFIATVNDTGTGEDLLRWLPAGGAWSQTAFATNVTVTGPSDTNTFYLGSNGFGNFLNGSLAAVKAWTVALTDAELQAEATTYAPIKTSGLWASYTFLNGPQTNDESGNNRTLAGGAGASIDASGPPIIGGAAGPTLVRYPLVMVPNMPMGG